MSRGEVWFFFSSRRRHTRWTGDWSSDVCSSDLAEEDDGEDPDDRAGGPGPWMEAVVPHHHRPGTAMLALKNSVEVGCEGIPSQKPTPLFQLKPNHPAAHCCLIREAALDSCAEPAHAFGWRQCGPNPQGVSSAQAPPDAEPRDWQPVSEHKRAQSTRADKSHANCPHAPCVPVPFQR